MTSPAIPTKPDDTVRHVIIVIFVSLLVLVGTLAGVIGVLIPLCIWRLWGRPVLLGTSLVVGIALLLVGWFAGAIELVLGAFVRFMPDAAQSGVPWALASLWLKFATWPPSWITLVPMGLVIGSLVALVISQSNKSLPFKLAAEKRALLASITHSFNSRSAQSSHKNATIGSDYISGSAIRMPMRTTSPHTMIVGASGSGKTVSLCNIIESEIIKGNGLVFIDGKGDKQLCQRIIRYCNENKRVYRIVDLTRSIESSVYNPLSHGDATALADRLMAMRPWTEPHYQSLSTGYVQSAFQVMRAVNAPLDLITAAESLDPKKLLILLRRNAQSGQKLENLAARVAKMKNQNDGVSGIKSDLDNLAGSSFREIFDTVSAKLSRNTIISLIDAREKSEVVIFSLPALAFPNFSASIGRLIVNDLKYATTSSEAPWNIILDEFSVFAGDQVLNLINQGRSFGVNVTVGLQSFSDIARGVPVNGNAFLNQVIGSVGNLIIHRLNAPDDAEIVASIIGTQDTLKSTRQTDNGASTGRGSERDTREFIVHPDEIKNIPNYHAILFSKNPKRLQRISVRKSAI